MSQRMEVYGCTRCGSSVIVRRGGEGAIACCGQPMAIVTELESIEKPPEEDLMEAPAMEHNLNMPVKTVMEFIQKRMANRTTYFGVVAIKNPMDFWVYREIIFEVKPDVTVEIGNAYGGGALALAHILDNMGHGRLIGVDHQHQTVPQFIRDHPRIAFIDGDACESFPQVQGSIAEGETVLVIEDSSHTYENTLNVLRTYSPLVTRGSYLIVEDSNCHHGVDIGPRPGPYEAVEQFITETDAFEIDRTRESWFITWNPKGYLKRIR
ncbi:MAG: hypothetical protein GWP08_04100 [Nitrospiraceae bacterium]|nr:hypothetical protein [Nitrospiraceae bacterium]